MGLTVSSTTMRGRSVIRSAIMIASYSAVPPSYRLALATSMSVRRQMADWYS
jgi:hypothetical protein